MSNFFKKLLGFKDKEAMRLEITLGMPFSMLLCTIAITIAIVHNYVQDPLTTFIIMTSSTIMTYIIKKVD